MRRVKERGASRHMKTESSKNNKTRFLKNAMRRIKEREASRQMKNEPSKKQQYEVSKKRNEAYKRT